MKCGCGAVGGAVDHLADRESGETRKIVLGDLATQTVGRWLAKTKTDEGGDISKNGTQNIGFKLVGVLVGEGKAEPEAPGERKKLVKIGSLKFLKLVAVKIKGDAL